MPLVDVTILGGLPVVADVVFYGPDGFGDTGGVDVNNIYWRYKGKRRKPHGKPIPEKVWDKAFKADDGWENLIQQATEEYEGFCESQEEARADAKREDAYFNNL